MAKKTSSKTKRQAPAEWQGAVDASAEQEQEEKGSSKKTGVVQGDGGPYVVEELDAETLKVQAHEMAKLIGKRAEVDQNRLDALRKYNKELKGLDDRIEKLAAEVESGTRKVPAQKNLPGTEARA